MEITKRLYRQTAMIILPLAVISFFIDRKVPLGILLGGFLGLLNLQGLSRGVQGLLHTPKATLKLVILSLLRFTLLFAVLVLIAMSRLVNLFGLLLGFTVVFGLLLKEGLRGARESDNADTRDIKKGGS